MTLSPQERRDRIYKAIEAGQTDSQIQRRFRLETMELAGFKAGLTRQRKKEIREYAENMGVQAGDDYVPGIFISQEQLNGSLTSRDVSDLVRIVGTISPPQEETQVPQRSSSLTKDQIRPRVIELYDQGLKNEDIYRDSQLQGANKRSISAIIAHCTMGSYE